MRAGRSFAPRKCVLDAVGEQPSVGQPGQRVGQCRIDELLVDRRILERDRDVVGEQANQLEVLFVEALSDAVQVECADDAVGTVHRGDDERLVSSSGVPGTWTVRGSLMASLMISASPFRMTSPVMPESSAGRVARMASA